MFFHVVVELDKDIVRPIHHTRSTDTRLIRTPGYCGQFRFSRRGKAHTFSLKLTRLIRTLWRVPLVSVLTGFHCYVHVLVSSSFTVHHRAENRPFPRCFEPHCKSEANKKTVQSFYQMKIIFIHKQTKLILM